MPAFSVKLAHLYQIDLAQAKIEQADWDAQPVQNKMRKFFLETSGGSWETLVDSVKCSTSGAKGVFLLDLKERRLGVGLSASKLEPALCALKATDAPQQTLFAEYILHDLGKAKTPKSLIIKLDWDEYKTQNYDAKNSNWQALNLAANTTDEGLKLLWVLMTKKSTGLTAEAQKRYDDLCTSLFTNKPQYFVLMKGVRIDDKLEFAVRHSHVTGGWELYLVPGAQKNFSPFKHKMVDPFNLPNQAATNKAYGLSYFNTLESELTAWWNAVRPPTGMGSQRIPATVDLLRLNNITKPADLPYWYKSFAQDDLQFGKVLTRIFLNKVILSNADLMKKAGRILAIDTLIGNADRFEGGDRGSNIGNAFFYSKIYKDRLKKGKGDHPIAVIDNEALLPILDFYTPQGLLGRTELGSTNLDVTQLTNQRTIQQVIKDYGDPYLERLKKRYLEYLFDLGYSDLENGAGNGSFRYPNLKVLFSTFDTYIAARLSEPILSQTVPLINDIYADDGTIAPGISGAYSRFSAPAVANLAVNPTWQPVINNIKAGFLEGMDAILNIDLDHYRGVYSRLLSLYGIANSFDFAAFEMRLMYITQGPIWQRNPTSGKLVGFQHDTTRHNNTIAAIKQKYLDKTNRIKDKLELVQRTAEQNQQLTKDERRLVTELLRLQFQCP